MITANCTVYGAHLEELTEAAYAEAVRFFRCHDDEVVLVDMQARQVYSDSEGRVLRWKADVTMRKRDESDEDAAD